MSKKSLITSIIGGAALVAGIVGASLPLPAAAATPPAAEASIPFVNHGGIRDWRAVDHDTIYVQDAHRRWYRAELMASCHGLRHAEAIGFDTGAIDRFDRFSAIVTRDQRCHVESLTRADPPPRRHKPAKPG